MTGRIHARLDWLARPTVDGSDLLAGALRVVLAVHLNGGRYCVECIDVEYPCTTVKVIAKALEVTDA